MNKSKELLKAFAKAQEEILKQINDVFAKVNGNGTWDYSTMQKYSRYNTLVKNIEGIVKELGKTEQETLYEMLSEKYKEEYATAIFDLSKFEMPKANIYEELVKASKGGIELGVSFTIIDRKAVDKTLFYPWSGENFSNRIWQEKDKLINTMRQELTQSMIQGESLFKAAARVRKKMGSSYTNAMRLARTEIMRTTNEAHIDAYRENDIKKVEWFATIPSERTCPICGKLDGKVYHINKKPIMPAHPNCRCTWLAIVKD